LSRMKISGKDLQNSVFHRLRLEGRQVTVYVIQYAKEDYHTSNMSGTLEQLTIDVDGKSIVYNPVASGYAHLEDDGIVITREVWKPSDECWWEAKVKFDDIECIQEQRRYFVTGTRVFGVFCDPEKTESCILYNGQRSNPVRTL